MQKISGGQDSPSGEGGAAGFGGEGDTGESKAELHGGHHYLQTMVGYQRKQLYLTFCNNLKTWFC